MKLEFNSTTPIYIQITEMIRHSIISGDLQEGDPIPSVRQVSIEYGLNPQTVLNATQRLIQEGIIEKKRGLGMYVKENAREQLLATESRRFQDEVLPEFVHQAQNLGIALADLCRHIRDKYEEV